MAELGLEADQHISGQRIGRDALYAAPARQSFLEEPAQQLRPVKTFNLESGSAWNRCVNGLDGHRSNVADARDRRAHLDTHANPRARRDSVANWIVVRGRR